MRNYVERAKDFIKEIFPFIDDWYDVYSVSYNVNMFNDFTNRKVNMRHGIARIAFITSDYVVKYDFDKEECKSVGGCENEVALYTQAKNDGFDYLFAEITHYRFENHDFYIMPRIRGIGKGSWRYAQYYMTKQEKAWCNAHCLKDLHCNNYGFRNGKICIVDYACQTDESESEYDDSENESWS